MRGSYDFDSPYSTPLLESRQSGFAVVIVASFSTAPDPQSGMMTGYTCLRLETDAAGQSPGSIISAPQSQQWQITNAFDIANRLDLPVGTQCWCVLDESHLGYVLIPASAPLPSSPPPPPGPPPGQPTSPMGTGQSTQATVTWTVPTGIAPTQYVVDYNVGASLSLTPMQFVVSPATATIQAIPNLLNGTQYSFAVYAINNGTAGPLSSTINVTPIALAQTSATIPANGTQLVVGFNQPVTNFIGSSANHFVLSGLTGGATNLVYASGNGTNSITFSLSRTVTDTETGGVLAYVQGVIAASSDASLLPPFTNYPVTNNSTQVQTYTKTAAGTYTFTASFTGNHTIQLWGAGGGSAGSSGAAVGGGGGGEFAQSVVSLTSGNMYTVVVGAGTNGNGADSTFATTTVVAKGGTAGIPGGAGAGGTGGTGTTLHDGGAGAAPVGVVGGGGGSSAGPAVAGNPGSGATGGAAVAGGGAGGNGGVNGTPGSTPGGAAGGRNAVGAAGASGADGQVVITW